jgi:hypothetical protein
MKVLPRIQGSGPAIASLLDELTAWAQPDGSDEGAVAFPICAQRISVMQRRLVESGFTSYWL